MRAIEVLLADDRRDVRLDLLEPNAELGVHARPQVLEQHGQIDHAADFALDYKDVTAVILPLRAFGCAMFKCC